MDREIEYPSYSSAGGPVAGMSWGAIFGGSFVAIAVMAALSLLGAGIGLASAPAAETAGGLAMGLGIGAVVWLIVSGVVSFYAGGWVTGRLTRTGIVSESVVHSAVTWAFATTAFLFLLTTAVGGALGGAASLLGAGVKTAAAGEGALTGAGRAEGGSRRSGGRSQRHRGIHPDAARGPGLPRGRTIRNESVPAALDGRRSPPRTRDGGRRTWSKIEVETAVVRPRSRRVGAASRPFSYSGINS